MTLLSVQAWAESMGMSRQAGYAAIKRCGIPVDGGQVDSDVATVLYRKRTRARANERRSGEGSKPPPAGAGGGESDAGRDDGDNYWASRARREQAEAELAELKLAEQRGELVRAADVRSALARKTAALREGFLQLPARVVPLLVAEPDAARMDQLLRGEIHAVLAQLTEE
jgi:phage terminase Nu1 subunit (DNA packaging protein)